MYKYFAEHFSPTLQYVLTLMGYIPAWVGKIPSFKMSTSLGCSVRNYGLIILDSKYFFE
jgi:hypothetical protein